MRWIEPGIELVEQRHRLPIAAQKLATGGARADAGDQRSFCSAFMAVFREAVWQE
jgi:hypothetical protein